MYFDLLFNLSRLAVIAWVLLVLFPRWRWTRWIISEGIFPFYLAVLYVLGIVPLVMEMGPDLLLMDFSNVADIRALFANPDAAVVLWIHILAFDQVAGMMVYEDNMANGYISIPLQSLVLLLVLFVGPLGVLVYLVLRHSPRRRLLRSRQAAPAVRTS